MGRPLALGNHTGCGERMESHRTVRPNLWRDAPHQPGMPWSPSPRKRDMATDASVISDQPPCGRSFTAQHEVHFSDGSSLPAEAPSMTTNALRSPDNPIDIGDPHRAVRPERPRLPAVISGRQAKDKSPPTTSGPGGPSSTRKDVGWVWSMPSLWPWKWTASDCPFRPAPCGS